MEEEPIQNDEQQGIDSPSNTYTGRDEGRSNTAYNLQNVKGLTNKYKRGKDVTKSAKMAKGAGKTIQTARKARQAYTAAQATYTAVTVAVGTSEIWVPLLIILIIIIVLLTLSKILEPIIPWIKSTLQIVSSGPIQAKIGDKLDYTITVNYPGAAKDIIITDQIPDGTEYVNAPQATYNPTTNTVTWNLAAITNSTTGSPSAGVNTTLSLTLLATKDNNYIINTLKGTIQSGVLGESDSRPASKANQLSTFNFQLSTFTVTPTIFQLTPTNVPVSPQDTNTIRSCVVTKIGEPAIIPSLPPECTDF